MTSHNSNEMADQYQPPKSVYNYDPSESVILLVGKQQSQMLVHKGYISAGSEFFKAALKKEWKGGQSRIVKLPEDDPDTVAQYLDFVYNKTLSTNFVTKCVQSTYIALANLYVFGERILNPTIQNTIVDHLISFTAMLNRCNPSHSYYPGPRTVDILYEGTPEGSPVRRLLVDMYSRHGSKA